jgi:hypothetical protein
MGDRFTEREALLFRAEDGRIGGLGLSVGGEQLLQAAAEGVEVRAVVSESAGSRSIRPRRS